jgi:peroxiredoxin Q/BCP
LYAFARMVRAGERAPDFDTLDCRGQPVSLASLRGRRAVLFFFPRAFTPGCTLETRYFRDNYEQIQALGARLVGVSVDDVQTQCDFAQREQLDFPLLADPERKISSAYGVVWPLLNVDRRVTFVLDEEGNVESVIKHELRVYKHLDDVLEHLRRPRAQGTAPGQPT